MLLLDIMYVRKQYNFKTKIITIIYKIFNFYRFNKIKINILYFR